MLKKESKKLKIKKSSQKQKSTASGAGSTAHARPVESPIQERDTSALDGLINSAATGSEDAREFMQPASAVPKKRGRPTNEEKQAREEQAQAEAPPPPPSVSKPMFEMTFKMLSTYLKTTAKDERFCLSETEIEGLSTGWAAVLDKYAPDALNKYALEISALAVTTITGVRLYNVAKTINKEREAKNEAMRYNTPPVRTAEKETQAEAVQ